jgi:NIMA (never in mitosis gene a)-related kinase 8
MTEEDRKASMNEIQVLSMLRHPNIIAYYDSFTVDSNISSVDGFINSGSLMIVMEYADGGTLHDFITQQKEYLDEKVLH